MLWKKSTFSADAGNCVELGTDGGPTVALRNSQHPDRGTLSLRGSAVASFVAACRAGELNDLA
jgi:Domain of unknown function (DUF397)